MFSGSAVAPFVTLPAKCSNIAIDDQNYLYVCCNKQDDQTSQTAGVIYRVV